MKTLLKLAVLALVSTTALALAGNALATQKLSVTQTTTTLTIKDSQAQTDQQPAKITIYVPSGYSINASATPGTRIGAASGTVFSRDANIPLPLSGDVIVAPPSTNAPGCAVGTHLAVWILSLAVAGQTINLPVHVDQTSGAEAALGAYKLVICLAPDDVPPGTPGRSPNGARLLDAQFTGGNGRDTLVRLERRRNDRQEDHQQEEANHQALRQGLAGRRGRRGRSGEHPDQREVVEVQGADECRRHLRDQSPQDRQEIDDDVPGPGHGWRAGHHVHRLRQSVGARRCVRQRDELGVHGCERQDEGPALEPRA